MRIGVPKEIKVHEYRVGLVPASVRELIHNGHEVVVEQNAGAGVGFEDSDFATIGAEILPSAADPSDAICVKSARIDVTFANQLSAFCTISAPATEL